MQERTPRKRNPPWTEEELVLALDLYLRSGLLDGSNPTVMELSGVLNALEIHAERPDPERFRNASGVARKLLNFAAIDPGYHGKGLTHGSNLDAEVWEQYAWNKDSLAAVATEVREGRGLPAVQPAELAHAEVTEVAVEAQHVERFHVSVRGKVIDATRDEQRLVRAFKRHLERQGHRVTRHRYQRGGPSLYCDLVDETEHVLYEAKGDVLRTSVRMAIGQLFDYRRFEEPSTGVAVLLPRQPAPDIMELVHSVPASVVWRTTDGFEGAEAPV